eukprot:CAMPEP_0113847688 /NCGR_PEP_ID=MMETSP0372-20130328/2021_1 /TAXON_ID=340204 /ORGANISM="Lankesteria abbotti" /LENGTH=191 /DNA_ID=CAMNT_0000817009 /DNA_START=27 /DNA_END=602 /DNA_ORIENTATION=+ /assembly_acc=CAM_ASM_000359
MKEKDRKRLALLLNVIKQQPEAAEFLEPVNWQKLKLKDYPQIVKRPLDLGSVTTKLENNQYATECQFWEDIELIWSNCRLYNHERSTIYAECVAMEAFVDSKRQVSGCLSDSVAAAELKDDLKLAYRIALLKKEHLNLVVSFLKTRNSPMLQWQKGEVSVVIKPCRRIDEATFNSTSILVKSLLRESVIVQ